MEETLRLRRRINSLVIFAFCCALCDPAFFIMASSDERLGNLFSLLGAGFFLFFSLVGLFIGIYAYTLTKQRQAFVTMQPWAILGMSLSTVMVAFGLSIISSSGYTINEITQTGICLSRQRELVVTIEMYSDDHHGKLPHSLDDLKSYFPDRPSIFECPEKRAQYGYGYNSYAAGKKDDAIPDFKSFILTADGGNSQHLLTQRSDIDDRRHKKDNAPFNRDLRSPRGFVVGYLDGHVAFLPTGASIQLHP